MRDFLYVCNMENNDNLIDPKMVEQIVKDSFGVGDKIPEVISIEYNDLILYTKFVMETVLKASFKETDKALEKQRRNITKLNYN